MTLEQKKFLAITMPDKSRWVVLVEVIARHRATYYASKHEFGGDVGRNLAEDTNPLFESDEDAIKDWAANNMDWDEVKSVAIKLDREPPCDYQEGWVNGEKEVIALLIPNSQ